MAELLFFHPFTQTGFAMKGRNFSSLLADRSKKFSCADSGVKVGI